LLDEQQGVEMRGSGFAKNNVLDLYLKDVARFDLLTPEEEKVLAKKVQKGDKEAATKMANCNLRLVISIAKRYATFGYPLDDMIAAGNIGLLKAVQKFDVDKGFRFSTYATWWIKQAIRKFISDKTRTIRIPSYQLASENAEAVKSRTACTSIEGVEGIENMLFLQEDPTKVFEHGSLLKKLIGRLEKRKRHIIELRYGLRGGISFTLGAIAEALDLSRERVRQLEMEAIREMRVDASPEDRARLAKENLG